MMKDVLLILLIAPALLAVGCGPDKGTVSEDSVKVRSVVEFSVDYRDESGSVGDRRIREELFDTAGNTVEKRLFRDSANLSVTIKYMYDDNNHCIDMSGYTPDDSLYFKQVSKFDSLGNNIELTWFHPDGSYKYKTTSSYDDQNRLERLTYYHPDGTEKCHMISLYDDPGLKNELQEFDPEGRMRYTWKYRYDRHGNLLRETQRYANKDAGRDRSYTYDHKGNKKEFVNYFEDGTVEYRVLYAYDGAGRLVNEKKLSGANTIIEEIRYGYNREGLLSVKTTCDREGNPLEGWRYEYTLFDSKPEVVK